MSTPENYEFVYIYGLIDPRTDKVRYVGWTVDTKSRISHHLAPSSLKKETYKNHWLKQLLSLDLIPTIEILETVPSEEYQIAERKWIAFFGRENLTNGTDGGDGAVGHIASQETKEKLSKSLMGREITEEHRKKIADGERGKIISEETRNKISKIRIEKQSCHGHEYSVIFQGRKLPSSSSIYMGVNWDKETNKWRSTLRYLGITITLGYFTYEIEAALAYNECALEYYGYRAKLNIISESEIQNLWNLE